MELLYASLLIVLLLAAWMLTVLGMPGNWLMAAAAALYAWLLPDSALAVGWGVVLGLVALAAVGEAVEMAAASLGVAKVGGSKRGAVLALVGSLVGGIVGIFVGLPIPVVGSLVAAVLFAGVGALLGAMLGETFKGRKLEESWSIGKAAFWGRLLGTAAKVLVGSVMIAVVIVALLA